MTARGTINNISATFIWVWDASKYKPITTIQGPQFDTGHGSIAFSPDGKRLAVAWTTIHLYGVTE
jgi:hypothetical protein